MDTSDAGPAARPSAAPLSRLILGCRALRSFAVGVLTVALPLALEGRGVSTAGITSVLAAGLAGATAQMQLVRFWSRHLGRCGTLALFTTAMAVGACALSCADCLAVLSVASFLGAVSVQPNISVQAPLEHAILADSTSQGYNRSFVFAWYNGISTIGIAIGSLLTGMPFWGGPANQVLATSAVLLATSLLYLVRLPQGGFSSQNESLLVKEDVAFLRCRHWKRILAMASLFAVDSFAGSLALNSILIHWLSTTYSVSEGALGTLFAVSGVITTPSLWVAAWLGKHIGLINTMVYTHLPSNVCLIFMPFMPSVNLVYLLVLIRAALGQMDVPARESFMMGVVDEEERVTCSSVITTSRALASIAGPPCCALLWEMHGPAAPLVVAGSLKCAYDLALLATFRAAQVHS